MHNSRRKNQIARGCFAFALLSGWPAPAQDPVAPRCTPLEPNLKQNLAARVRARYQSEAAATVQLVDESLVSGSCYHRLIFEVQSGQRFFSLPLYLTPDQRYLTRDLTDLRTEARGDGPATARGVPAAPPRIAPASLTKDAIATSGSAQAPATVVVFSDFQCPYCKRAAEWVKAETTQFKPNQLRVVYRFFPLSMHPWAQPAAEAAACVASQSAEAFWSFHDKIFSEQQSTTAENVKQKLTTYAQSIRGIDVAAYQRCVESGQAAEIVRNDLRIGASAQVRGTPSVFINGVPLPGLRSPADLHGAIEQAVRATNQAATTAGKTGGTE